MPFNDAEAPVSNTTVNNYDLSDGTYVTEEAVRESSTVYSLSGVPVENGVFNVFINGVFQNPTGYSVDWTASEVTFTEEVDITFVVVVGYVST